MVERLVYVAHLRLPTEKAHGYQICKMSEAFVRNGVAVLLLHSYRHQVDPALQGGSVFDYYNLPRVFEVKTLPNIDVIRMDRFFPGDTFTPLLFIHAVLWGYYAARTVRREKADLYYTRHSTVAYWLVRLGLPTVYEAHMVPKRARRWLLRRIARHPALQLVVVLTSFIKERLVAMGFPPEKIIVLPDGVDLSLFADLPSKEECRRRLGLPQDRLIIGYIGRFRTMGMEKGMPELIQSMAYLPSVNGKEPLLLCVGGPMDTVPAYLDFARRHGLLAQRLQFFDRVANREVPFWIRAFDVAVAPFPANEEHYTYFMSPLKLFEYMAAEVPIVASDLPSIREVLQHGESAWLVEPGNPKALAEGLDRLLCDATLSGRKMANNARQAVNKYTWNHRAGTILNHIGRIQ